MKYTEIITQDGLSFFRQVLVSANSDQQLGGYSLPVPCKDFTFRQSKKEAKFDWHPAP